MLLIKSAFVGKTASYCSGIFRKCKFTTHQSGEFAYYTSEQMVIGSNNDRVRMVVVANNFKFTTDFNTEPSLIGTEIFILKVDIKLSTVEN